MANETAALSLSEIGGNEECTRLFEACKKGKVKTVLEQLNKKPQVPTSRLNTDGKYETCLEMAVKHKRRKVAKAIIKHRRWRESLKISDERNEDTPFRTLAANMPDIAMKVLDKCVGFDPNTEMYTFAYEYVGEFSYPSFDGANTDETDDRSSDAESEDADDIRPYTRADEERIFHDLNGYVLEQMEGDLLVHPVVLSFLRWKWLKYMAFFFFLFLGLYLTFLIFLTAFALNVPNPQRPACSEAEYNQTNTSSTSCDESSSRQHFLIIAAVITIICSLVRLFLELVELSHLKGLCERIRQERWRIIQTIIDWKYFRSASNYIEIPLFILSIVFVSVFQHECLCPTHAQWQAGIIAVFLAWIDLIFYLEKLPLIGIYVQMLLQIIKNFCKVSIMAIFLLLAFGLAFYMAFYEPDLPDTPFENPAVTFVHMISYAIASPDISIFRLSNDDTRVETIPYLGLSYIIWIIFAVVMSVLFLNLLTGLAVEDVHELWGQAQKNIIKQQIDLLKKTEVWIRRLFLSKYIKVLKNRIPSHDKLSTNDSFWDKLSYILGAEKTDIVKRASEIEEAKKEEEEKKYEEQ